MARLSKTVIAALRHVQATKELPANMHWRLRKTVIEYVDTIGEYDWAVNAAGLALLND